ncbi:hypothetical protein J3E69DRAFT_279886 [Trichoderma sp. SZMC 28015]
MRHVSMVLAASPSLCFLAARRFEELMRMQVIYEGAFGSLVSVLQADTWHSACLLHFIVESFCFGFYSVSYMCALAFLCRSSSSCLLCCFDITGWGLMGRALRGGTWDLKRRKKGGTGVCILFAFFGFVCTWYRIALVD